MKLVSALQKMYRLLQDAKAWPGPALEERMNRPLTHDVLVALKILQSKDDGTDDAEYFEEDHEKLKAKLLADGAGYVRRRSSISSDSDHSQLDRSQSTPALESTAQESKPLTFKDNFNFNGVSPLSFAQNTIQQHRQSFPATLLSPLRQSSPFIHDPQFYAAEWSIPDMSNLEQNVHSNFAMQGPTMQPEALSQVGDIYTQNNNIDAPMSWNAGGFSGNTISAGISQQPTNTYSNEMDYAGLDPTEIEFHKYVQCNG